jgi:hypothetical protein
LPRRLGDEKSNRDVATSVIAARSQPEAIELRDGALRVTLDTGGLDNTYYLLVALPVGRSP